MTGLLWTPFHYGFFTEALAMAVMISVPAALLSCFLVLKGWSLIGDGISHAVLPGIVLAYVLNLPLLIGAFVAGMICALSAGWLDANSRVKSDTVLGVVMSGMFGLGVILYTQIDSPVHLDHILFGDIYGLTRQDFVTAATISAVVSGLLLLTWKDLALHAFDPVQARVAGLRVRWLHYGLLAMISASVVAMLSAVGIILSVSLMIAPGAIAFLLCRSLRAMMAVAVAIAMTAAAGGVWLAFWVDSAPAPTIVVILTAIFALALTLRMVRTARR